MEARTAGLTGQDWLQVLGAGLAVFFLVELEKAVFRKMGEKSSG